MAFRTLDDMDLAGRRVLVRVDLNVPVDDRGVSDETRLRAIVPTVNDIVSAGGKPVLIAHFGRPKGEFRPDMSLQIVVRPLRAILGLEIVFAGDCVGERAVGFSNALGPDEVMIAENTRFHPGEEANDPAFAAELAKLGDVYVNDAFSCAHRAHASTEGLARLLPSCAGRLMQAELRALDRALGNPARPVVAVVGGAKVSTKIALLENLVTKADTLVIGGGMANTFLAARGHDVGRSLAEHDLTDTARRIEEAAEKAGCTILLPTDVVVAKKFEVGADHETVEAGAVPPDAMILDAGPNAVDDIRAAFGGAKTVVWNGPLGAFEIKPFNAATDAAARAAAALTEKGQLVTVAGGGDTVAALNRSRSADRFSYVSTAGGAFLEWLEGKALPGVKALEDAA